MNYPNEQSEKEFIFCFMVWLKNCKSSKLAFLCIEGNLQRVLKWPGPLDFNSIKVILISNSHGNRWQHLLSFIWHEYLKIWESISKMVKPYCEVLTQACSTNSLANPRLKCSSLWKKLGPQCMWTEANFQVRNLSLETLTPTMPPVKL